MTEPLEPQREVTLRFLAPPTDLNVGGKIHGGAVMKWIDEAAYICAAGWSGRYCVTVYVGGIRFYQPIHAGDLVEIHAQLAYTGTTSMHIAVDVRASNPQKLRFTQTTHCIIIFVALDENGRPVPVPKWHPRTEQEKALEKYVVRLMELRKAIEAEMKPHLGEPSEDQPAAGREAGVQ